MFIFQRFHRIKYFNSDKQIAEPLFGHWTPLVGEWQATVHNVHRWPSPTECEEVVSDPKQIQGLREVGGVTR